MVVPSPDNVTVAIQGYKGSLHHLAASYYWSKEVAVVEKNTFAEVYAEVVEGRATHGLVAIEDSVTGSVLESLEQLLTAPIQITGETIVRVKHNLLAKPNAALEQLTKVYSHPVALHQSQAFFASHPNIQLIAADDAGKSVERMMRGEDASVGAVATSLAAEIYGAQTVAVGIETNKNNLVRFLVITKKTGELTAPTNQGMYKTSLLLWLPHVVGSLAHSLGVLANNGCNLLRIESRPVPDKPWEYVMYLDLLSSHDAVEWQKLAEKLREVTTSLTVLGRYLPGETYNL